MFVLVYFGYYLCVLFVVILPSYLHEHQHNITIFVPILNLEKRRKTTETQSPLTSHLKSFNIKQKTTTYDVGHLCLGLGQPTKIAQSSLQRGKCKKFTN